MQANILIDSHARARLVDFGLSIIKAEFEGTSYSRVGGALRYRAPELLSISENDFSSILNYACDIYSYGSVTLQVGIATSFDSRTILHVAHQILSGKIPYHDIRLEHHVLYELFRGVRPKRPSEPWVTDALWEFIQHCWNGKQSDRPGINEVNDRMTEFHRMYINRDRCLDIPFTDGYETDSEAFRSSGPTPQFSGWQSDHESYTKHRKSAKKSRSSRHR